MDETDTDTMPATEASPGISRRLPAAHELEYLGFTDTAEYFRRLIRFYRDCLKHHERLAILNAIAEDLTKQGQPTSLQTLEGKNYCLRRCGKLIKRENSYARRWERGEDDPAIEMLKLYRFADKENPESRSYGPSEAELICFAVARSLTYIRVMPPPNRSLARNEPKALEDCWALIEAHPYFTKKEKNHKKRALVKNINQHCLDMVIYNFGDQEDIVMKPERIPAFIRAIEASDKRLKVWDRPSDIFLETTKIMHPVPGLWESIELWGRD